MDNTTQVFLELLRAGLWEKDVRLSAYESIDYNKILRKAEEQSVVGLVSAGLEHVVDCMPDKLITLQFVGQAIQLEQRNLSMNTFIADLIEKMREEGINSVLVKGQGIAQCYERPLWRASGDVDFLLDKTNYEKAKSFFAPLASSVEQEEYVSKHIGFTIDPWIVELHGHMYFGLLNKANIIVEEVEKRILNLGEVRVWNNKGVNVLLPNPDNDIIIIFTHFLGHFCFGGVGLRQLCDLCRLLCTYKGQIDNNLLAYRLEEMGLESEWRVFGALAVDWLGMHPEDMPLYRPSHHYNRKAKRALRRILKTGNLGQNLDESYRKTTSMWKSSFITLKRRVSEFFNLLLIFPLNAPLFFVNYLLSKKIIAKAKKNGVYQKY